METIWIKCLCLFQRDRLYILSGILQLLFLIHSGGNTQVFIEKLTSKLHFKRSWLLIHLLEPTILVWLDSNLFYSKVLPVQLREISLIIFFYQLALLSLNTVI